MSMSVAKKGPAENAGSILNRLSNNGMQEPKVTDAITIMARVKLMAQHCSNVPAVKYTRTKAVIPKIRARTAAIIISLRKNLNIFWL